MTELIRIVRFAVGAADSDGPGEHANGHGGFPSARGLDRYFELSVRCRGELGSQSGYIVNIKVIDDVVRSGAAAVIARACRDRPDAEPGELMPEILETIRRACPAEVSSVTLRLSPYYCVEMEARDRSRVLVRQRFEFAASHRLHVDHLSDEENLLLFGKCNNPRGHGHNYIVEPCVECALGEDSRQPFTLLDLERLTIACVVEPFDHRNLNLEVDDFGPGGVNPTVENIARVCYERLAKPIGNLGKGARLRSVTVWESERTAATYPA